MALLELHICLYSMAFLHSGNLLEMSEEGSGSIGVSCTK